ncbi:aldose 1-epimerase family protein [Clostridium sediminicola]|uniref:aldose 1-epimerase family protein n=1 Tax=Clostridium sediminicola TaxID=3114879 RepID=UPI0031F26DB7
MAQLFNKEISKDYLMKRVGDISQIAGAKQYELSSGKGKGVSGIDVKTGTGFEFTVLPDRGMDIAWASYKGIPISFISKTGIVSSAHYNEQDLEFLRSFYAGLLTTCGLTYMGAPCEDQGEQLGLHGRISNIPAEDVSVYQEWENGEFIIKIRGKVRESRVFGENITLTREISTKLGDNKIIINDIVENCGFNEQPLMMLYHCNFGYPFISEDTKLITNNNSIVPRNEHSQRGLDECKVFDEPIHNYMEEVFYHDILADENGDAKAVLFNPTLGEKGLGAYVKYNKEHLPNLIEWKQMGEGDYAVGLEPSTWYPDGRAIARDKGELLFIEPGEKKEFKIEIGILDKE